MFIVLFNNDASVVVWGRQAEVVDSPNATVRLRAVSLEAGADGESRILTSNRRSCSMCWNVLDDVVLVPLTYLINRATAGCWQAKDAAAPARARRNC